MTTLVESILSLRSQLAAIQTSITELANNTMTDAQIAILNQATTDIGVLQHRADTLEAAVTNAQAKADAAVTVDQMASAIAAHAASSVTADALSQAVQTVASDFAGRLQNVADSVTAEAAARTAADEEIRLSIGNPAQLAA